MRHALVIGVSKYTNGWPSLEEVKRDVEEVSAVLEKHCFQVEKLMDPTRTKFDQVVSDFIDRYGQSEHNRLLIYFSGHGDTLKLADGRQEGYIIPADAPDPVRVGNAAFKRVAISMQAIVKYARDIESKQAL
jgi:uncharacterized caspase-like protein